MAAAQEVYSINECLLDVMGIDNLISLYTSGQQMRTHPAKRRLIIGVGSSRPGSQIRGQEVNEDQGLDGSV